MANSSSMATSWCSRLKTAVLALDSGSYATATVKLANMSMASPAACTALNSMRVSNPRDTPTPTCISTAHSSGPGSATGALAPGRPITGSEIATASAIFTGAGMARVLNGGTSSSQADERMIASSRINSWSTGSCTGIAFTATAAGWARTRTGCG